MTDAIIVRDLGKRYRRYHTQRPRTLQEAFMNGWRGFGSQPQFWALRHVSLSVPPGEMVGIVGANGAGKSTLLQLIGGVGHSDEGGVEARGRIGAMFDLGAGFHQDLTGRENVFINGVIAGLTRRQVAERFEAIVNFAELEEFIDNPLRTYSSGMRMRLAFAIAANTDPEILLIDEVLAVGDLAFQSKCLERITQFKEEGCAIVLVSHEMSLVRQFCEQALWLRGGRVAAAGVTDAVLEQYEGAMQSETRRRTPTTTPKTQVANGTELQVHKNRFGSLELQITSVRLLDGYGDEVIEMDGGQELLIQIAYCATKPMDAPIFGFSLSREDGTICCESSTAADGLTLPSLEGSGEITARLERLDLARGQDDVDVGVYTEDWAYAYDYHWHVYPLKVRGANGGGGIISPPHTWEMHDLAVLSNHLMVSEQGRDG